MVLPLVPLAIIAGGALTGAGGVVLGGAGASDLKKARSSMKASGTRYNAEVARHDGALARTNDGLKNYGEQQERALVAVVVRMGAFLRRNARKVRETERLLVDGVDVTMGSVVGPAVLDVEAVTWLRGAIGSAATGAGIGAGVTSAAGTFGVASTGAAISGLSGAAAESATLAFLGGGSLASGGGGMAMGATILNVAVAGPAILVGGFVVKTRGDKAKTQAREYDAKVEVAVAELEEHVAKLEAVDLRTEELHDLLTELTGRAVVSLDLLESERFEPTEHAARFHESLNLVMAVRDVTATPVVDGSGGLNDKTGGLAVRYRTMTESDG